MQTTGTTATERAAKHVIFQLGVETFGVDAMQVREIVGLQNVTTVPGAARGVKGVINLRGKVVPVIDVRTMQAAATPRTSLIVMNAEDGSTVAMIVDEVLEVGRVAGDVRLFDVGEALGAKR